MAPSSGTEPFRKSVENLRQKVSVLLKSVKQCANVVDRINELACLRDIEQRALPDPKVKDYAEPLHVRWQSLKQDGSL